MAKRKLTARAVATAKPGRHGDGDNLYLIVSPSGARRWVFRFVIDGKATEAGLGSAEVVSLAEARDKAHEARRLLKAGENPIEAKRRASAALIAKPAFGAIAEALMAAKESAWRNEKHRAQWRVTLSTYAKPIPPPRRRDRHTGRSGRPDALVAEGAGNGLAPARPDRGGSRRGQGARPSIRRKSSGVARTFGAPAAEARQTRSRPPCRAGLYGHRRPRRQVAPARHHPRPGARIHHFDGGAVRRGFRRQVG